MTDENSDSEIIPGITVPLAKILPTTNTNTDNHGFPVKRCSSRKRSLPDFFVPTHFRPSTRLHDGPGRPRKRSLSEIPASEPFRRAPSRPRKQRSDEIDVEIPTAETTQIPSSRHLRHGPGRPRKQRLAEVREMKGETVLSPEVTEAPAVSPPPATPLGPTGDCLLQVSAPTSSPEAVAPTLLWSTSDVEVSSMAGTQSPASQLLRRGPGSPGKQQSVGDETLKAHGIIQGTMLLPEGLIGESPLQVSVTSSPKAVATTPLGSTGDRPLELPSNEKDTKLNFKPSRLLMDPSKTNYTPQILDEELKKVTVQVKSLLVKKLLTSGNDVDYMVHQATTAFRYLKGIGVDYGSFYRNIIEHIKHCSDLRDAEKEETMSSLSALQKNYENAILSVNVVEEDLGRTQGELEKAKEKKERLKRQIEDLKQEVAGIEHEEEHLKRDEIKYKEAREVAKAKMQELGTQLEAAQAKLREIEQRKNAALRGIESTTRHLQSTFLDDLN